MVSLVSNLMKCTCKLLSRMNERAHLRVSHLKGSCKSICLLLEHFKRSLNHVLLQLILNDCNLWGSLVVCFHGLVLLWCLHWLLNCSSWVLSHLRLDLSLMSCISSRLNLVHMMYKFPMYIIEVLLVHFVVLINLHRNNLLIDNHH